MDVVRYSEARLPTPRGEFRLVVYRMPDAMPGFDGGEEHVAMVMGDLTIASGESVLTRVHSSCFTGDLLDSLRCDCGSQLQMALEMIEQAGCGVLVYLPQEGRGIGLVEKIKAYELQERGLDTVEANQALGFKADMRDYGVGIQILKDLGLRRVRLLTNNPKKIDAFIYDGFDLQVVDQVPIIAPTNPHNARYLSTKREKLGHKLPAG